MGRVPERCWNRRSLRQWADVLAISRVRTFWPTALRLHCIPNASATGSSAAWSSALAAAVVTSTRMKKLPGGRAAVLLRVRNIAARHQQGAGHGVHDSGAVRAGQGYYVRLVQLLITHAYQPTRARPAVFGSLVGSQLALGG